MYIFEIPYPPSVNHMYGHWQRHVVLTPKAKTYYADVFYHLRIQKLDCLKLKEQLKVRYDLYPPDKRRRDCDNVMKALNDALMQASMFLDDSQVVDMRVIKHESKGKPGKVLVTLEEIYDDLN